MNLPEAATAEPSKVTLLALTMDAKGEITLNGETVNEAQIRAFVREQRKQRGKLEAVIAADKDVRHGRVVRLIDLVRQGGVTKFAINVLKPE